MSFEISMIFFLKNCYSMKNSASYCHKCTKAFHVKYLLFLLDFKLILNILDKFFG